MTSRSRERVSLSELSTVMNSVRSFSSANENWPVHTSEDISPSSSLSISGIGHNARGKSLSSGRAAEFSKCRQIVLDRWSNPGRKSHDPKNPNYLGVGQLGFRSIYTSLHRHSLSQVGFSKDRTQNLSCSNSNSRYERTSIPENEQQHSQTTLTKWTGGEPIGVIHLSVSGNLTLKEPLTLLSSDLSCSLRITNTFFELLYDQGDSVFSTSFGQSNLNESRKKTQHRSHKVWITGSVTSNSIAFTLRPSKLIVSMCGVERGLGRHIGGFLGAGSPQAVGRKQRTGNERMENGSISYRSNSSIQSLTPYWFASEGFFLDTTCMKAKEFCVELCAMNRDIADVLWRFLPESMFKERVQNDISADQQNDQNEDNLFFRPFLVTPTSKSKMTVSNIDLEVEVRSNVDGANSSISLSVLEGLFFYPEAWPAGSRKTMLWRNRHKNKGFSIQKRTRTWSQPIRIDFYEEKNIVEETISLSRSNKSSIESTSRNKGPLSHSHKN